MKNESSVVKVSDLGFALIVAEGQLDNAQKQVKRWRLREQEAMEMRHQAQHQVDKWIRIVEGLQQQIGGWK